MIYLHYAFLNSTFGFWIGLHTLGYCFYMRGNKISIFFIRSISLRCLLKSVKRVSYSYRTSIAYITIGKQGPVVMCAFYGLFPISASSPAYHCRDDTIIERYMFRKGVSLIGIYN